MAGSGTITFRKGMKKRGQTVIGSEEAGYGVPTHVSPQGTIYYRLDGTTSTKVYKRGASSWSVANS